MTRRRVVVLSSAVTLLGLVFIGALAVVSVLKTQFGRNYARNYIERLIAPSVKGKLHIGRISGLGFGGATIDSAEIRGPDDSLFVATGQITVRWDPRDIVDKRTLISYVEVDGPVIHLRKHPDGVWNYKRVFPPGPPKKRLPGAERGFKDFIVADSVVLRRATLLLSMPWNPDDSLRGAKRDSSIARNLTRKDKEIRRSANGFERTWRWTGIEFVSGYTRLADPDSVGRLFQIARLDADEFDPPFKFRNVRGSARQTGDSLWLDLAHFDLPKSTGKAAGKVVWGSGLDTRYDLRVVGDSVSLSDVNWVYPTLPMTGGGSLVLNIKNEQNLKIIDYALSNMDVRTTRSRLLGNMTFGVGGPVLIVKDLALQAQPVNFDLIRALNGKPFPYDWQGNLSGTIRARGGPVNRFRVDDARITFNDANVPGAITRATARGDLDILFPAFTTFRGLDVDVAQLDLRTLQFLNPNFPKFDGIVSGTATLDSVWLDTRFRKADLTHRDGPGEPTRATGSGRVTIGEKFTSYDLALNTQPLSFTTLAHAYKEVAIPLRGSYQGPLRIQGNLDDLSVTTELTGPAGTLSFDGRVDGYPVAYAGRGTLTFLNLDIRSLLANDTLPVTSLNGRIEVDITADSGSVDSTLKSLAGVVSMNLDRSLVDSMRVYQAVARLGFGGGRARVDTVRVETVAGNLSAHGALGLTSAVDDSLSYRVTVDSLGGFRRYFPASVAVANAPPASDSIDGTIRIDGKAYGSIDSLRATGELDLRDVWFRGDRAKAIIGGFEVRDVRGELSGNLSLRADTAVVAKVGIQSGTAYFRATDRQNAEYRVQAQSSNGPALLVHGRGSLLGDTTLVRLDTVTLAVRDHRLTLERPATITIRPDGIVFDSLRVRDANSGLLTVVGSVPQTAPVSLAFRADSVELGDIGELIQANVPFSGLATVRLDIGGVRADPRITIDGTLDHPRFGDVRLDRATLNGTYATKRMESTAALFRGQRSILSVTASVPVDLALKPIAKRLLADSLRGKIRSDSVDLAILETVSPLVVNASGTFAANLDIGGVWPRPALNGSVTIVGGALGLTPMGNVRLSDVNANLKFLGDSLSIERFSVATREERVGGLTLSGYLSLAERENPRFDLTLGARDFHIIDKPRIAHLDVSASNLRLAGSYNSSTLTGLITVDRGTVIIPELSTTKQLISLDNPQLYNIIDTTLTLNRALLPTAPPALVRNLSIENVQVRMGSEVWLRSAEANINLGGSVQVARARTSETGNPFDQLALDGTLTTNRGTYRLNLGGIVQRTFLVENGTVRFFGDADFNPELNIAATHTVHRSSTSIAQQDIGVRVQIRGTLAQPRLTLSSADSLLTISETDLVSYLLTGAPSFSVTSQDATLSLLRSVGSYFGDWLRGGIGFVDVIDVELGRQGLAQGFSGGLNSVFNGARLTTGKQVGSRAFVSAATGLCQVGSLLGGTTGLGGLNLAESIGVKIEYRLSENLGISAGSDPPTSALLCSVNVSAARGFTPTNRQWGFDIFRLWRF
ncbi:MAG TPA: translocation/assembly module TamB domain-containing protein [Gemmatimonadaceae bacterium]|nr:translocation/assembly module TamB domain-containing protein [Gemmatimonadaceae bacterium]